MIRLKYFMLWLSPLFATGQTFEGKLVYNNTYTSKMPNVKSEQFNAMMGTVQEYYIKGGNYKSVTNGSFAQVQLYIAADNRLYNKLATSDTLYWIDGRKDNDPVVGHQILKDQEEILGIKCDALVVESKSGKTTYYFNSNYQVDPNLYKAHNFGNWYFVMDKIKSVPLKMVVENARFSLVSIATDVKQMKLDDGVFKLPDDAKTKVSPY